MGEPSSVIGRASHLLRLLAAREPEGISTTGLAAASGLARPTAHRLLGALADEGLTERDPNGFWHLGPECFLLGAAANTRHDVTEAARPIVRRLAADTGESAFLSVRRGDETVCLLREDGSFPIRSHVLYEGIRFPLGVASAGLAILSFLTERDRQHYLDRADLVATHGDVHARGALQDRIDATRRDGFATNPGLIVPGSWGLGAAVFNAVGEPQWALSVTGVESRIAPPRRDELGEALMRAAHRLHGIVAASAARR